MSPSASPGSAGRAATASSRCRWSRRSVSDRTTRRGVAVALLVECAYPSGAAAVRRHHWIDPHRADPNPCYVRGVRSAASNTTTHNRCGDRPELRPSKHVRPDGSPLSARAARRRISEAIGCGASSPSRYRRFGQTVDHATHSLWVPWSLPDALASRTRASARDPRLDWDRVLWCGGWTRCGCGLRLGQSHDERTGTSRSS